MDYFTRIDYSSLSEFQLCPRKFFFKYILHLSRSGIPNLNLVFGSAWHYGLERAYLSWKKDPSLSARDLSFIASEAFNLLFEIESEGYFDPESSFPKSPARAADMFSEYFERNYDYHKNFKIIGAEVPFRIPLSSALPDYIGRLDLVLEDPEGFLYIYEHKTAKMINAVTLSGFTNSLQAEGYLTAGNIFYNSIPRVIYNIALCQKTKIDFISHEVTKSESAIDRFLIETSEIIHLILDQIDRYSDYQNFYKKSPFPLFPRSNATTCCTNYFSVCSYFDLCRMRNNPTLWAENPPQGFEISEWDPEKHDSEIRRKLEEAS